MEGCLVRAVRLLALFVVLVWLVFLADCVGGLALNLYWPTWERDISTWTNGDSSPTATPTAETAQAVRRAPAEAQLDRRARRQVQRRLRDEGFDPGTPDGLFGRRTRAAIRDWQRSRGLPQSGYLDGAQVLELTTSAGPANAAAAGDVEAPVDVVRSEFFTRGSHADDVLQIQGTPTRISTYSDSEVWGYGLSTVTISRSSREVTEWWNSGNLRVRLEPRETDGGQRDQPPVPVLGQGGEHAYEPGDGVEVPRLLREVTPRYTAAAMRQGLQGTVVVEAVVLPDGSVGDVAVLKGLCEDADQCDAFGLDEEALRAARQFRFEPGTRLGVPVAMRTTLEFTFTLR